MQKLNLFKHWVLLAFAGIALSFAATSCDDDEDDLVVPEPEPEIEAPVLKVPTEVEAKGEGESFKMYLSVINPNGADPHYTCSADWIKNVSFKLTRSVEINNYELAFDVAKNEVEEPREAKITLTYKGAEDVVVTIKQAKGEKEPEPEPEPKPEPETPVLTLDTTTIEINDLGGDCSVTYAVENPVEGAVLQIKSDQDWVHDFFLDGNKVLFKIDENPDQARSASVTFSYDKAEPVCLTIHQAAFAPYFKITIQEDKITTQTVTFNVEPKDKEGAYAVIHISTAFYDKLGSDDAIFEKFLTQYRKSADFWGEPLLVYLEKEGLLFRGDKNDILFEGDDPESEYYILAFGINEDETRATPIIKEYYKTKAVEKINMTFDLNVDVAGMSATIHVTPSMDDQYYFSSIVTKADLDAANLPVDVFVQGYMKKQIESALMFGGTAESVIKEQCQLGVTAQTFDGLASQTEYYAFAVGFNLLGEINTECVSTVFATEDVGGSLNEIEIRVTGIGADKAVISTTTTNDDPYVIMVHKVSRYGEEATDQDIVDYLVGYQDIFELSTQHLYKGDVSFERKGLSRDCDYYALAFGFDGGVATTPLVKVRFTTGTPASAKELSITTSAESITNKSAYVTINGTPNSILYFWDVCKSSATDQELIDAVNFTVESQIAGGWVKDRLSYFLQAGKRGTDAFRYDGLESGTEYVPYAIAIDENNNGEFATGVLRGTPFRTADKKVSEAAVEVIYGKYWDADELAAKFPDYNDFAGQDLYCLPIEVTTTGDVAKTYMTILGGDYSDSSIYDDQFWIDQLITGQLGDGRKVLEYFVPYDMDCTIGAIGVDSVGNYTHAFAARINNLKAGAEPIDTWQSAKALSPFSVFKPAKNTQKGYKVSQKNFIK